MSVNCTTSVLYKIQNKLIPSINDYKYLGIEFNDEWNNKAFFKAKKIKTFKSYMGCYSILKRNDMPTKFKVMVIKAIIQAVATYGGNFLEFQLLDVNQYNKVPGAIPSAAAGGPYHSAKRTRLEYSTVAKTGLIDPAQALVATGWMGLELVYPELKAHINYVFKIPNRTCWAARRNAKSEFIEKIFIEECPFCRNITPETITHMLIECSRWQALRADILAQYINIYRAQVATKPPLLPASISMRLVGKLLGICKDPTVLCVKTTLATAKFFNAIALPRYLMLNSIILAPIPSNQCPPANSKKPKKKLKHQPFITDWPVDVYQTVNYDKDVTIVKMQNFSGVAMSDICMGRH
ncbi:hypothetical protein BB561_006743 [Smittium simulii]|uniref:Uncharacterized protein n=1 Tax=Smittium simulii TaxID=133385 RepID=A0A2T9Y1W7_9FUNG|nr:hypothetical protein BB561_006743 [Smittium simulii]